MYILQQLINGLDIGAIYASLGLALVLVYRIATVPNFGQGEMATLSAYLAWQLDAWGFSIGLAVVLAIILSAFIGGIVYIAVMRPVQGRNEMTIIIVTVGVFLIFNSLTGALWGYLGKSVPSIFPSTSLELWSVRFNFDTIGIVVIVGAIAGALWLLFQKTRVGLAFRASASSRVSSQLLGIPYTAMVCFGWVLAGGIGAVSGLLVAPKLSLDPNMMHLVLMYAIAGAVIGGLSSYLGTIVGGLLLGIIQTLSVALLPFIDSELQTILPLVAIIIVLSVKPEGLFGYSKGARV